MMEAEDNVHIDEQAAAEAVDEQAVAPEESLPAEAATDAAPERSLSKPFPIPRRSLSQRKRPLRSPNQRSRPPKRLPRPLRLRATTSLLPGSGSSFTLTRASRTR